MGDPRFESLSSDPKTHLLLLDSAAPPKTLLNILHELEGKSPGGQCLPWALGVALPTPAPSYFPQLGHMAAMAPGRVWAPRSHSSQPANTKIRNKFMSTQGPGKHQSHKQTAVRKPLGEGKEGGPGGIMCLSTDTGQDHKTVQPRQAGHEGVGHWPQWEKGNSLP